MSFAVNAFRRTVDLLCVIVRPLPLSLWGPAVSVFCRYRCDVYSKVSILYDVSVMSISVRTCFVDTGVTYVAKYLSFMMSTGHDSAWATAGPFTQTRPRKHSLAFSKHTAHRLWRNTSFDNYIVHELRFWENMNRLKWQNSET